MLISTSPQYNSSKNHPDNNMYTYYMVWELRACVPLILSKQKQEKQINVNQFQRTLQFAWTV